MKYEQAKRLMDDGFHVRRPYWHECRSITVKNDFMRICANKKPTNWYDVTVEDVLAEDWEEFTR